MLQFGKNITAVADPLRNIEINELVTLILKPDDKLRSTIQQLRTIMSIDAGKYRQMKTILPYFVCGIFNPPFRKTENFGSISYLTLDFDHLHQKNITPQSLKEKLSSDSRILLAFISPGNDGLKVMFKLAEKCYDFAKYSMFYKIFAGSFSRQYNIEQIIDQRTSDVTRACFLSIDERLLLNNEAEPISISGTIDFDNISQITLAKKIIENQENEFKIINQNDTTEPDCSLTPDLLQQIKLKLGTNIRTTRNKQIVPSANVDERVDAIIKKLTDYEITVKEIITIHYGKKFIVEIPGSWAEINVFYGKNGFSVVKTPKRGSNEELCDVAHKIICQMLL